MGSGLLDYYRRPYQVYDAMKAVYARVLISLERDPDPYVIGREKIYERAPRSPRRSGSPTTTLTRSRARRSPGRSCVETGQVVRRAQLTSTLPADAVEEVDRIEWPIPATAPPGAYRVTMEVLGGDGGSLSTNHTDITVR